MPHKSNQKGFAVVETVLIIFILALVGGTGYYVWHSQNEANNTYSSASKVAQTNAPKTASNQKYLTIKEWGVRVPYISNDTLSYSMQSDNISVQIISGELATKYGCTTFGAGFIGRSIGTDNSYVSADKTAAQAYAADASSYKKIGDYYYNFSHDQAACSNTVTSQAENATNDFTRTLVSKLEIAPSS